MSKIIIYNEEFLKNEEYILQIKNILQKYNNEFVPPLSYRSGTLDRDLIHSTENSIDNYLQDILKQNIVYATIDNQVIGFVSYIKNYSCKELENMKCFYISTIIIKEEYRRQYLSFRLTDIIYQQAKKEKLPIIERTWSTNFSQINSLNKLGFTRIKEIKNDRGNGINTLYFIKY